jgi:hypothetical protein
LYGDWFGSYSGAPTAEKIPASVTGSEKERMKSKYIPSIVIVAVLLAVLGSMAFAAQDRYTLKLGKLAFSDFRGYENWKDVAVSQTETLLKVIVANDVMINAYRRGLPADGKLFPEGSKIMKIEWTLKRILWPRIP